VTQAHRPPGASITSLLDVAQGASTSGKKIRRLAIVAMLSRGGRALLYGYITFVVVLKKFRVLQRPTLDIGVITRTARYHRRL
jgi:hypothetical protein